MLAVLLVILAGVGIGFLGLLVDDLYFVGAVVIFIGLIGLAVRSVDLARRLLRWFGCSPR